MSHGILPQKEDHQTGDHETAYSRECAIAEWDAIIPWTRVTFLSAFIVTWRTTQKAAAARV